jgi:hypothetical protein
MEQHLGCRSVRVLSAVRDVGVSRSSTRKWPGCPQRRRGSQLVRARRDLHPTSRRTASSIITYSQIQRLQPARCGLIKVELLPICAQKWMNIQSAMHTDSPLYPRLPLSVSSSNAHSSPIQFYTTKRPLSLSCKICSDGPMGGGLIMAHSAHRCEPLQYCVCAKMWPEPS